MKTSRKSASAVSNGKSMRCHRAATDRLHIGNRWINHAGLGYYDNTARYFDALTVRFTAADRLEWKTPQLSPWSHCAGNPVNFIDPSGMEIVITGSDGIHYKVIRNDEGKYITDISTRDDYVTRTLEALNKISEGWVGNSLIGILHEDKQIINIKMDLKNGYDPTNRTILWNDSDWRNITELENDGNIRLLALDPYFGLAHESFHALSDLKGYDDNSTWYRLSDGKNVLNDEKFAVIGENFIRAEHDINARPGYFIQNDNFTTKDYLQQPGLLFSNPNVGNLFKSSVVRVLFIGFLKLL